MAKTLKIAAVSKEVHSAFMRDDVVNLCCKNASAKSGALSAKRLCCQLSRSEILCPNIKLVQSVPSFGVVASLIVSLWLVFGAVSV